MHDIDLTAMEVLMVTLRESKSTDTTVVSLAPAQTRTKRKSEKAGQSLKATASDRGFATGLDYDWIIGNPGIEKKFRDNRKFLEGVFDTESVNLITPHKILCPVESCRELITLNNICGLSEFTRHLKRHKSSVVEQTRAQAIALLSRWSDMQAHGSSEVE